MAENIKVIADKSEIVAIADAVRSKTNTTKDLRLSEIVSGINGIEAGITPTGTISISENGTYNVEDYASAEVNVASSGGGSASIDTCTVLFSPGYYDYRLTTINNNVAAVIDGQVTGKYVGDSVDNVLCNTLAIITTIENITSITVDGSSDNVIYNDSNNTKVVLIPNKNNQNVEIDVETI